MYFEYLNTLFMMMFIMGFIAFTMFFYHILSTLISLEFMALTIFFSFSLTPLLGSLEFIVAIYYLAIAVCEGALGLSIIILFSRAMGNEMFSSANSLLY